MGNSVMNNKRLKMAMILFTVIAFTTLTQAQVTSWVTKPVSINTPDYSDSATRTSDDGRYVAFSTRSSNYADADTNLSTDVFIKDTHTNTLTRLTNSSDQQYDSSISFFSKPTSDGSKIAYSTANGLSVKNLSTGVVTAITFNAGADTISLSSPEIYLSDDGRYIIFETVDAINPIDTNSRTDIYRKDLLTGVFKLLSINTSGQAPAMGVTLLGVSRNGKYVAFESESTDIHLDVTTAADPIGYIKDIEFSTTVVFSIDQAGNALDSGFFGFSATSVANSGNVYFCSRNSNHVANDNNNQADIFKYSTGSIIRLSFASIITEITDAGCRQTARTLFIDDAESSLVFSHTSLQLHPQASANGFLRNLYKLNFSNNSVDLLSQNNGSSFGVVNFNGELSTSSTNEKVVFNTSDAIIANPYGPTSRSYLLDISNNNQINYLATPVHNAKTLNSDADTVKMSDDQNHIYFATRANNVIIGQPLNPEGKSLYHYNRLDDTTQLVTTSYGENNTSANDFDTLDVSPNGRYAVYNDVAVNGLDLVLFDSQTGQYFDVGEGLKPKVNDDGNVVFFPFNNPEVYLFDKSNGLTQQLSVNTAGSDGDGGSFYPDIAGTGLSTWIVFVSSSTDLIVNDVNNQADVFMVNWPNGDIFRISESGVQNSTRPYISSDTTSVVYSTLKYDRISNNTTVFCKVISPSNCGIDVEYYGVSPSGRYVSFSPSNSAKKVYLYDSVSDTTTIIATNAIDAFSPQFMSIGVDDSFAQPKIGVLYTGGNKALGGLYGINNIASGFSTSGNGFKSGFLYQQGGDGETLNLVIQGTGQVVGGLNCTSDCNFTFNLGAQLTLSVIEPVGQTFIGWQGDCVNQSSPLDLDCDVIMDTTKTITAKFIDNNDRIYIDGFEN
jgi:hypothetical protein